MNQQTHDEYKFILGDYYFAFNRYLFAAKAQRREGRHCKEVRRSNLEPRWHRGTEGDRVNCRKGAEARRTFKFNIHRVQAKTSAKRQFSKLALYHVANAKADCNNSSKRIASNINK